ncbi:CPBP family intramembrane glutamic endopeptidase [Mesobacillus zeae]|uniref:CPBP family intramembrane metalloprotease n=1 Tax=Mesobacillus zeae TaxID=1917180 RepID=A0A398BCL9_9BACI|nr:CPBP family intramembrane glutamic endopeptidase [Mesobacillus zeae]RID87324.1 CPBP family intramembrane metalloprotease [Mesobacillus zeae]
MKNKYSQLIKGLTDKELLFHLYTTQVLLLIVSLLLGIVLFDSLGQFLGLFKWDDPAILMVGLAAGIAVVLADLLLMKILPPDLYDDGGLNEKIFRNRTVPEVAFIALFVAFGEEILFRGVIQTSFGLIVSSVIFALVHYRYLFKWFLFLNIMVLSFFIGFIYLKTENLAVTVTMHFLIDFLLGISICLKKTGKQEGMFNE